MGRRSVNKTRLDELRSLEIFAGCSDEELERIDRAGTVVDVPAGRQVLRADVIGRQCFVVIDGVADVTRRGRTIAAVGRGGILGEMSMLYRNPRTADAIARTPMRVLAMHAGEFSALLADIPSVGERIERTAAARRDDGPQRSLERPGPAFSI